MKEYVGTRGKNEQIGINKQTGIKKVCWIFFENLVAKQCRNCTKLGLQNKQAGRTNLLNSISVWLKKNLKHLSEHACLLGSSEYLKSFCLLT